MRKVVVAAAAVLVGGSFLTTTVGAQADAQDRVVGAGENNPPPGAEPAQFNIDAHSDADGSNAWGHVSFNVKSLNPEATWSGEVICLNVSANRATIVVKLDRPAGPLYPYDIVWVEDNGAPVGGTPVDFVINSLRPVQPSCSEPFEKNIARPITQGNVTVTDG